MDFEQNWDRDRKKLGLVKNYLRYVHDATFGLVAASRVGIDIEYVPMKGSINRYVAVSANENVYIWDLKTKELINQLTYDSVNPTEVSAIKVFNGGHSRTNLIAVGYADGYIRIYEYQSGTLRSTFTGHRRSISALAFDKKGSRLASGCKDSSIVVWDIFGDKGLFCLKGHKNSITQLEFIEDDEYQRDFLVSSSLDIVTAIKIWDLAVQHCFRTIHGSASGVYSFCLLKNNTRLVTGSSGSELKVYSLKFLDNEQNYEKDLEQDDIAFELDDGKEAVRSEKDYKLIVKHMGNILRNNTSTSDRVDKIRVDPTQSLMVCHSTRKTIELYGLRSNKEALSYARKRLKKERKRGQKRKERDGDVTDTIIGENVQEPSTLTDIETLDSQTVIECEINRKLGSFRLSDNVKALSIVKLPVKLGRPIEFKFAVVFATNKISSYIYQICEEKSDNSFDVNSTIDCHDTDVRSVAISNDNKSLITASAVTLKIWNLNSLQCIGSIDIMHATSCIFANPVRLLGGNQTANKFALVSTKQGSIQIIDLHECEVIETIAVSKENKPLTSITELNTRTGIVCGSEDKIVRFYDYKWISRENERSNNSLSLEESRILEFSEGITCVTTSQDLKFLAVSLLDSTVRIHFMDTFKYFLTLYGHKFPILSMDISDDSKLIVTGSVDKNIKIWGLDFGDLHKSIFAHDDAVSCVKFVPKTHYLFTCGHDGAIKEWDCDKFIRIQALKKHQGEVWSLAINSSGNTIVTCSHDKSLRLFCKTEELLVPEEEELVEREYEDEKYTFEQQESVIPGEVNMETGFAPKRTIEVVKSTERLMEAIDVFGREQDKEIEYKKLLELSEQQSQPKPALPEPDPLLMVAQTADYRIFMLEILRRIHSSNLEEILITLPFDYVRRLLVILVIFIDKNWDIELMVRAATFLLRVNFGPITACALLVPVVTKLRQVILNRTSDLRDLTGFNMMAVEHLKNRMCQKVTVE